MASRQSTDASAANTTDDVLYESCLLTVRERRQAKAFVRNLWMQTVYYCVMLCWLPQANSYGQSYGRAVYGVRPQPLARIAGSHPAESMNLLLLCTVAASVKGWSLVQRIPTGCEGLIVCHVETSKRCGPIWATTLQRKELLHAMPDGAREVCVCHASCTAFPVTQLNTLHHYHGLLASIVSTLSTNPDFRQAMRVTFSVGRAFLLSAKLCNRIIICVSCTQQHPTAKGSNFM